MKLLDVLFFSFHAIKNVTTGEGGAVICRSTEAVRDKLIMLRSHGIEKSQIDVSGFLYSQKLLGYNYRITDFSSSMWHYATEKLEHFYQSQKNWLKHMSISSHLYLQKVKLLTLPVEYNDAKKKRMHL